MDLDREQTPVTGPKGRREAGQRGESLEPLGAGLPRPERACLNLPEPMKALSEFHFDLGNSGTGPIGFCASLRAADKADAVELLKRTLPDEISIMPCGSPEDNARVTYIQAYLNQDAIGERDIDARDDQAVEREVNAGEPKIHQREHDGRFVILDQNDTPFWWASFDNEAEARLAWSLSAPVPKLDGVSSAIEKFFDAAAASTSFELDDVLRGAAVTARMEMARAMGNTVDVAYWEKRAIQESEDVKTVVDDVLERAYKHDFNPVSSGNTADLVRDSASLNDIELTPVQVEVAVEMIQDQFPTAD